MSKQITIKQKAFADYYIKTGNAYQSAVKAGYSVNYAKGNVSKLLENERVKVYIGKILEKIQSKRVADAQEVMEYLSSVMRGESTGEVVVVVGDGDGCSSARRMDKSPDEKEKLKAAELLGKRYAIFTDKVNLEIEPVIIVDDLKE